MAMDADEFYVKEELENAISVVLEQRLKVTACRYGGLHHCAAHDVSQPLLLELEMLLLCWWWWALLLLLLLKDAAVGVFGADDVSE